MTQPTIAQLRNLTDRAGAGLTPDEQQRLRDGIDRLHAERTDARQKFATVAAQRDRLRTRMNTLADRWEHALGVDKPYARTLRAEISIEPFHAKEPVTDTPAHGCTIDGQPAMPVLVAEYNQLVTRATEAEAELDQLAGTLRAALDAIDESELRGPARIDYDRWQAALAGEQPAPAAAQAAEPATKEN